jgi:hypothetical protein
LEFKDLYKRICSEISKYAEEGPLQNILQKKFNGIFTESEVDIIDSAKNSNDQVLFGLLQQFRVDFNEINFANQVKAYIVEKKKFSFNQSFAQNAGEDQVQVQQ